MKSVVVFIICLLVGFFAVFAYDRWSHKQTIQNAKQSVQVSKEKIPFSVEKAPAASLRAEIISMTGEVLWESRVASTSSPLLNPIPLQQGETIETAADGGMEITIPEVSTIGIGENTKISFIQTLPQSVVIGQSIGVATYTQITKKQVSVRSLHLLIVQESGEMTVSVDEEGYISVSVTQGAVSVAFNDLENVVTKVMLEEGQEYLFDDASRTGEVLE